MCGCLLGGGGIVLLNVWPFVVAISYLADECVKSNSHGEVVKLHFLVPALDCTIETKLKI